MAFESPTGPTPRLGDEKEPLWSPLSLFSPRMAISAVGSRDPISPWRPTLLLVVQRKLVLMVVSF
jgi:hypothetical protein